MILNQNILVQKCVYIIFALGDWKFWILLLISVTYCRMALTFYKNGWLRLTFLFFFWNSRKWKFLRLGRQSAGLIKYTVTCNKQFQTQQNRNNLKHVQPPFKVKRITRPDKFNMESWWPHDKCTHRPPDQDVVLCSWTRHFTLRVPLSTQVYKWILANLMLGCNPVIN